MQTIYVIVNTGTGRMYGRGCRDWKHWSRAHCYTERWLAESDRERMLNGGDYRVEEITVEVGNVPDSYPIGAA